MVVKNGDSLWYKVKNPLEQIQVRYTSQIQVIYTSEWYRMPLDDARRETSLQAIWNPEPPRVSQFGQA